MTMFRAFELFSGVAAEGAGAIAAAAAPAIKKFEKVRLSIMTTLNPKDVVHLARMDFPPVLHVMTDS
jgi:hypothetical protein